MLILPSQPSSPDLTGYLDSDEPHAINYLLVHKLGNDEVIATVRDDGDVEVFLVRHVVHAIATRLNVQQDTKEPVADNLKPIFQRNVGISAWGLAIHAQARIIAVSSNRHEVTIFRFSLVDETEGASLPRRWAAVDGGNEWDHERRADNTEYRPDRHADVTRQVLNGEANIPHIAFCNTGDDPDGRWLLTTDISGVCRAIDLHNFSLVQAFRFGPAFYGLNGGGYDRMNAGWGIMFLDTRSFITQETIHDALGMEDDELPPDVKSDMRVWDLSKTLRHLPDASAAFSAPKPRRDESRQMSRSTTEASSGASSPLADQRNAATPSITATLASVLDQVEEADSGDDDDETGVLLEPDASSEPSDADLDTSSHQTTNLDNDVEMWSDLDESDDEPTEDSISPAAYYSGERVCGNVAKFVRETDLCEDLPCPILHTSIRNVYLLQPSKERQPKTPFLPPMVGMAAPLKQSIQAEYRTLNMFDRLSMHAYIPTLGVVILASQKGRAIVLSLTRVLQTMKYPPEVDPTIGLKTNYSLRAECTLPFESQEQAGQRPFSPLHGIAVGPIQGTEDLKDKAKTRWRLMMMYQDHSMLSYEIRRTRDVDVGVEGLVV